MHAIINIAISRTPKEDAESVKKNDIFSSDVITII